MDFNQIAASIGTFILGIGVVWTVLAKFTPKARKYFKIAKEALDIVDSVLTVVEDKTLTTQEIENIAKEAKELKDALK